MQCIGLNLNIVEYHLYRAAGANIFYFYLASFFVTFFFAYSLKKSARDIYYKIYCLEIGVRKKNSLCGSPVYTDKTPKNTYDYMLRSISTDYIKL